MYIAAKENIGIHLPEQLEDYIPAQITSRSKSWVVGALTSVDDIFKLETEWLALEQQTPGAIFFQAWHWNREFLNHCTENSGVKPFVLTARENGKLIALLPFAIQHKRGAYLLTGLSEPYQQYTDMLVAEGYDPKSVFQQWMPQIRKAGVDYLHLGQVKDDSVLFKAIDGIISPSGEKDEAPFVDLSNWEDFNAYHASLNSKTRKNMRNARNRLEKTAPVTHTVHESGKELAKITSAVYEQRGAWLERMGLTSRAFSDEDFQNFIYRFKTSDSQGLEFIATSLTHGDHPIAEQFGFIHQGCYYAYISGWDDSYKQFSPGKAHLGEILKACYDKNLTRVDFMIPGVAYKYTWAENSVGVCDYVLPLSLKGSLYNRIWLNFLRPHAKALFYKIPSDVRARLFKVFGL